MSQRSRFSQLLERLAPPGISDIRSERDAIRQSRKRLIALLFLFDSLLIVATMLSFQEAELIEQEQTLQDFKETVVVEYTSQVETYTTTITEIVPYGSVP